MITTTTRKLGCWIPIALSVFTGSFGCAGPEDFDEEVIGHSRPIVGGVQQHLRPEIGDFIGCTATMIADRWMITAAHCMSYLDVAAAPGSGSLTFATSANGVDFGLNGGQRVPILRTFSLSDEAHALGAKDVMIAYLGQRPTAPAGIAPAAIASTRPTAGPATIWGQGCNNWGPPQSGAGIMRSLSTSVGATTRVLCNGDSGGPKVTGTPGARGPIYEISSGFIGPLDVFGDAVRYRDQIVAIMGQWSFNAGRDIFETGWCTGTNQQMIFGDVNGDRAADAICHDRSTGARSTATSVNRFLAPNWSTTSVWCNAAGDRLMVGDFNGDARTDLLCFNTTTGRKQIDFATATPGYTGTNWTATAPFCTHATAELHAGDFNGDGRTDLLCKDTGNGRHWIDFADVVGRFDGVADWSTATGWCYHAGAKLYTGDTNGDARTDLICHTPPTGAVDVDLSAGGGAPFANYNDRELRGPVHNSRLFCEVGRLEIGDFDGNGRSDLLCYYSPVETWPSLRGMADGGVTTKDMFGWKGPVRLRSVNAAAQPWQTKR